MDKLSHGWPKNNSKAEYNNIITSQNQLISSLPMFKEKRFEFSTNEQFNDLKRRQQTGKLRDSTCQGQVDCRSISTRKAGKTKTQSFSKLDGSSRLLKTFYSNKTSETKRFKINFTLIVRNQNCPKYNIIH